MKSLYSPLKQCITALIYRFQCEICPLQSNALPIAIAVLTLPSEHTVAVDSRGVEWLYCANRYAIMMRCARKDQSTCTVTLHYLSNGAIRLRVAVRKQEFLIPLLVVLKALKIHMPDREAYGHMVDNSMMTSTSPEIEC